MTAIDRRGFIAGALAALAAACSRSSSDDGAGASTSVPATTPPAQATTPPPAQATTAPATAAPAPATTAAAPPTTAAWVPPRELHPAAEPFAHGVASGEPSTTSVLLWTQLTRPTGDATVEWIVSTDPVGADVVTRGDVAPEAESGAVRVTVPGLDPGRNWFYRFSVDGVTSVTGRTATLPGADLAQASVAVLSCQHYEEGHFGALGDMADHPPDLAVHLGDFVYAREASGPARRTYPHGRHGAPQSLTAWRQRYDAYLRDPDLQRARAAAPWLVVWDDNDRRGDRAAAVQAFWEHQPIATPPGEDGEIVLRRRVDLGRLATLVLVDTRPYRDGPVCDTIAGLGVTERCPALDEPARTMLGDEQEAWLAEQLAPGSPSRWHIVANQVVMTDLVTSVAGIEGLNADQWDGYPAARERLLATLAGVSNPVVVSGDLHTAGLSTLRDAAGTPVAVEVLGPSVSAVVPPTALLGLGVAALGRPGLEYFETGDRGWVLVELDDAEVRLTYRRIDATMPGAVPEDGARFVVTDGGRITRA
jgi:alkaline phosphatase D